jgi:hypothetical protein
VIGIVDDDYQDLANEDRYDEELEEIKTAVENLAAKIQEDINEDFRNAEPDAYDPRRGHNLV